MVTLIDSVFQKYFSVLKCNIFESKAILKQAYSETPQKVSAIERCLLLRGKFPDGVYYRAVSL